MPVSLDDIEITGVEEHPVTDSLRLHGPPGTGKTTQSAARVAHLLRDHGYSVGDLAWVTYRRSLADETLDRFVEWELLDPEELVEKSKGATRYISTIHAVARRAVGGTEDPVETHHKKDFCEVHDITYETKNSWSKSPGKELFRYFGWMTNNCLDPSNKKHLLKYPNLDLLQQHYRGDPTDAWEAWERYKLHNEIIDFYEMLEQALNERAVPTGDVLVVDEYHDATALMARVCEMWMRAADIVIVAGDPHQVVNQYDGADPYYFERLELPKVLLDRSYRVGVNHWTPAATVLSSAHDPLGVNPSGYPGDIYEYNSYSFNYSDGSGWSLPTPGSPGSPSSVVEQFGHDMMFLARTRMQADAIGAAFENAGIIYNSQKGLRGWNADRASRRLALYNALQKIRGITPDVFEDKNESERFRSGLQLYSDEEQRDIDPDVIELTASEAGHLLANVDAREDVLAQTRKETSELVGRLEANEEPLTLTEFDEYVTPTFWHLYTAGAASERKLIANGRSDRDRTALRTALTVNNEPVDPDDDRVRVQTIHAAKGGEAADVVIYDGITNRIQQSIRSDEDSRKNEARVWYVALTRASERLHIMRHGFPWTESYLPKELRAMVPQTTSKTTDANGGGEGESTQTTLDPVDIAPADSPVGGNDDWV